METIWLAFANSKKFDAISCFRELGHSNWKMGTRHFSVGDIIYFYVSSERKVMFKTRVIAINMYLEIWDDDKFWSEKERKKAKGKARMILDLIDEYHGEDLNEDILRQYGLPEKKSSLQQPVYGGSYSHCINYIRSKF
jgi:hypothetical protein